MKLCIYICNSIKITKCKLFASDMIQISPAWEFVHIHGIYMVICGRTEKRPQITVHMLNSGYTITFSNSISITTCPHFDLNSCCLLLIHWCKIKANNLTINNLQKYLPQDLILYY